jgi:hypothetical protein
MEYRNPQLPSNLYTGGAERVDTRQIGQMLLAHERQGRMIAAKQDADLQKQYNSEKSKLLGVDQPGAAQRYNAWKQQAIALQNDQKLRKDPTAFTQAQHKLSQLRDDYDQWVGNGAQRHEFFVDQSKIKPEDRNDNHGQRLSSYIKTPMDKLADYKENGQPVDLTNYDSYIHTDPNYDVLGFQQKAFGAKTKTEGQRVPVDKQGLQYDIPEYEHYANSPSQVFANVLNSAAGDHKTRRYIDAMGSKLHDEDFAKTEAEFNAVPKEEWTKRGLTPSPLPPLSPDASVAEKTARYIAQRHFIDNPAVVSGHKPFVDEGQKMKLQYAQSVDLLNKRYAHEKGLIAERKKVGAGEAKTTLDGIVNGIIEEAKKNPVSINTTTEKRREGYFVFR